MAYKILHDLASAFPSPLCLIPGAAATTTAFLFSTAKFAAALSDLCQGCFSVPCPSPLYQLPPELATSQDSDFNSNVISSKRPSLSCYYFFFTLLYFPYHDIILFCRCCYLSVYFLSLLTTV